MVQENSLELFQMPSRQLLIFAVAESTFCSRRLTKLNKYFAYYIIWNLHCTYTIVDILLMHCYRDLPRLIVIHHRIQQTPICHSSSYFHLNNTQTKTVDDKN